MLDYYLSDNIYFKDNDTFKEKNTPSEIFETLLNETAETIGSNCDVTIKLTYAQCEYHYDEQNGGYSYFGNTYGYNFIFTDDDGPVSPIEISMKYLGLMQTQNFYSSERSHIFTVDTRGSSYKIEATNPCIFGVSLPLNGHLPFTFVRL